MSSDSPGNHEGLATPLLRKGTVLSKKVRKLQLMKHYLCMSVSICLCVAMTTQSTKFTNGGVMI